MSTQMTLEDFLKLPEIVLPFKCEENNFVLTQAQCVCPICGKPTEDVRGEIYESFGVLELKLVGICLDCCKLIEHRGRIYPKRGIISEYDNGTWKDYPMLSHNQIWVKVTWKYLKPVCLGLLAGLLVGLMLAPTFSLTLMFSFCCLAFVLTGLCILIGYLFSRKQ